MGISRVVYDSVAQTSREVGIPFVGHVTAAAGLQRALEVGQSTIEHLDGYWPELVAADADVAAVDYGLLGAPLTPYLDASRFRQIAAATRDAGVWNVPTLSMAEKFVRPIDSDDPRYGLRYMPKKTSQGWIAAANGFQKELDPAAVEQFLALRLAFVKALHDAGAGLLLGADAPQILNVPGFSVHRELELLVAAGLTPAEALVTGTINPALFLGRPNSFGRIAEGLDADLILVERNPLDDISALRNPTGVMVRGTWIPADMIRARLDAIAEKNNRP